MNDATLLNMISSAMSTGLFILVNIAMLIAALTVVRRKSGTAAALIASAAGIFILLSVLSPFVYAGSSRFGSTEDFIKLHAVVGAAFAVVRAAGHVLLIGGVIKLAASPKTPLPGAVPPTPM